MNRIEFRAGKTHPFRSIELWGFEGSHGGPTSAVVDHFIMRQIKEQEYLEAPTLCTLDATAAQVLMDDLWACGIRPTEGAGSAGALAATQRHLEDTKKHLEDLKTVNALLLKRATDPPIILNNPAIP